MPQIKNDHKKTRRLYQPRNHPRVNQTSIDCLRSWRANCDVQILIYDSDPHNPNISEIAGVSDYIVAYSCKGNATLKEEMDQNKAIFLSAETLSGDKRDIQRTCRQILNKTAGQRLISKQECMVLLGELDLVTCSETIETISISNKKQVGTFNSPWKIYPAYIFRVSS